MLIKKTNKLRSSNNSGFNILTTGNLIFFFFFSDAVKHCENLKAAVVLVSDFGDITLKLLFCLSSPASVSCLPLSMAEPAELLLIKDQYELAFHSLSRGLAAEEAGNRAEALEYYRKGELHLTQGMEVPTAGERQQGATWDTARQLQQRMRDTLKTVSTHLSDLETSPLTTSCQRGRLLIDLPPSLYPDLAPNSQPPQSSLHHLYPTIPATTQNKTPTPKTPPVRPPSPAALHTHKLPAAGTTAMANPGDQPPAYTPQPTLGHRSLAYGPAGGGLGSGAQTGVGGDGKELLFIPSGVQMFFVAPNGQVSSLSSPGFLRIMIFDSQQKDSTAGKPSAFLHVSIQHAIISVCILVGVGMLAKFLGRVSYRWVGVDTKLPQVKPLDLFYNKL